MVCGDDFFNQIQQEVQEYHKEEVVKQPEIVSQKKPDMSLFESIFNSDSDN